MMDDLRRFLATPAGKVVTAGVMLLLIGYGVYSAYGFFHGDMPGDLNDRVYIDPTTGQSFHHHDQIGDSVPLVSPFSGQAVALPAEACYWNKDGSVRSTPFYLLLNSQLGKPGPTFCPDCGRLVVPHNPVPKPGSSPPPTQAEWMASHSSPIP